MKTILLVSPYWKEEHRWMVSSVKLAELWQRLGFAVCVVCMGSESRVDRISDTLTVHYRKDIFIPDPWNYGIAFGFTRYVRRLVQEVQPDHIVVNKILFWTSLCLLPLRLRGHRVTLLTDALVGMTWWPRGTLPRIGALLYAHTLGWLILLAASRVVTFHPQPPQVLRRLGIARKTQVIPTGIDPASFDVSQDRKKGNTISYIGRLESIKGVDDFLAATVPLKKDFPHWNIQVVGWYADNHPLVKQYEHDVTFTGLRDDVPDVLGNTDIFVMPSHSEGLSNAVMEAMSAGCACVVSDVGGNSYLVQNGVSGFRYPASDREALKAHIKRLIEDPAKRRAMGKAARKRIEEEFSWESVGRMYTSLFDSV